MSFVNRLVSLSWMLDGFFHWMLHFMGFGGFGFWIPAGHRGFFGFWIFYKLRMLLDLAFLDMVTFHGSE
jgi:hypothetical protein